MRQQQEKKLIEYALKKKKTTRKAAEFLGIPQTTLARKKLKHNLSLTDLTKMHKL